MLPDQSRAIGLIVLQAVVRCFATSGSVAVSPDGKNPPAPKTVPPAKSTGATDVHITLIILYEGLGRITIEPRDSQPRFICLLSLRVYYSPNRSQAVVTSPTAKPTYGCPPNKTMAQLNANENSVPYFGIKPNQSPSLPVSPERKRNNCDYSRAEERSLGLARVWRRG